jgi:uracil-DNA glycosylase family 4
MPGFFPKDAKILVVAQNPGQLSKRASGWDDNSYAEEEQWRRFQQGYARGLMEAPMGQWLKQGFSEETVWALTNIIKCRTPDNSLPTHEEVYNCREWLEDQIRLIDPWAILSLGNLAHSWFFDQTHQKDPFITTDRIRNKILYMSRDYYNGLYMTMYHPAYEKYRHTDRTIAAMKKLEFVVDNEKAYRSIMSMSSSRI